MVNDDDPPRWDREWSNLKAEREAEARRRGEE